MGGDSRAGLCGPGKAFSRTSRCGRPEGSRRSAVSRSGEGFESIYGYSDVPAFLRKAKAPPHLKPYLRPKLLSQSVRPGAARPVPPGALWRGHTFFKLVTDTWRCRLAWPVMAPKAKQLALLLAGCEVKRFQSPMPARTQIGS